MELDPSFEPLVDRFGLDELDAEPGTVIGLWPDLRIALLNRAWFEFAAANHGDAIPPRWSLGAPMMDAVSGEVRPAIHRLLLTALATGEPVGLDYECSTSARHRDMHLHVYPLERRGLLLVHSLRREYPHDPARAVSGCADDFSDANGLVVMCANCRRVRDPRDPRRWEFVPELVRHMPERTSHGLCELCLGYYFPPRLVRAALSRA